MVLSGIHIGRSYQNSPGVACFGAPNNAASSPPRTTSPATPPSPYRLPFWHYTTPLIAKRGQEARARRWLLLGSFDYEPPLKRLEY
jgi:hypothetical protein